MAFQHKTIAAMLLLAPMLWSCHDGGDNNDAPAATTPPVSNDLTPSVAPDTRDDNAPTAKGVDLFNSGSLLYAVDRNSNTPKVVDQLYTTANASINAGYVENFRLHHWLFSSAQFGSSGARNIQAGALLYANGPSFKRALVNGTVDEAGASIVSSEALADRICDATPARQLNSSLNKATLKYQLPGNDGLCNSADDVYRRITLGMSANDAPLAISASEYAAVDIVDGNDDVKWHLTADNGKLTRHAADMSNPSVLWNGQNNGWSNITQLETTPVSISSDGAYTVLQVEVHGTKSGSAAKEQMLFVLNNNAGSLSAPVYIASLTPTGDNKFASGFDFIGNQNGYQYFTVNDSEVIRFPESGGTFSSVTVASGVASVVGLTSTHLLLTKVSGNTVSLLSQDLNSVAGPVTLKSAANLSAYAVSADRVFFHISSGAPVSSYNAASMKLDGTGEVTFNNAKWAGFGVTNHVRSAMTIPNASTLLLAQNISLDSKGSWSGGTLSAVSASSGNIAANLGNAPAQVSRYNFVSVDYSGGLLGYGYSADGKQQYLLSASKNALQAKQVSVDGNRSGWLTDWVSGR